MTGELLEITAEVKITLKQGIDSQDFWDKFYDLLTEADFIHSFDYKEIY